MGANLGQFPGKNTDHEPYWAIIKRVINESDLILEILDARLVELSRNEEVERLIDEIGRPMIFVVNKSDLVSKDNIKEQIKELSKKGTVVFVSTKKRGSTKLLLYTIKKVFRKFGKRYVEPKVKGAPKPRFREAKADIVVGVLGYPNVGKSSIINKLSYGRKMKVSKKSGTTHGLHWVTATKEIKLIDTPGVIPIDKNSGRPEDEIRYGLIGAKDNERLRHPDVVAHAIIKLFIDKKKRKLEDFYGIVTESESTYDIIEQIARKRNFLLKGGEFDENRTCTIIIRDWQEGRLRL